MFKLIATVMLLFVVGLGESQLQEQSKGHPLIGMTGDRINITDALYMTAIKVINPQNRTTIKICGGSVISNYWIITSTQCCISTNPGDYSVVMGTADIKYGGWIYNVDNVIVHENFEVATGTYQPAKNDIALIKVRYFISPTRSSVPVILNQSEDVWQNFYVNFTSWGFDESGNSQRYLRRIRGRYLGDYLCNETYPGITCHGSFCAYSEVGDYICKNSEGSPLTRPDNNLIGIASHTGPDFCRSDYPKNAVRLAVYTDVRYYLEWICRKSGVCSYND